MNLINKCIQWSNFRLFYLIYYLVVCLLVLDVLEPYIYYLYTKLFYVLDNPLKIVYHYMDMSRYAFLDFPQRVEDPDSESWFPSKKCFQSGFYFGNILFILRVLVVLSQYLAPPFIYVPIPIHTVIVEYAVCQFWGLLVSLADWVIP